MLHCCTDPCDSAICKPDDQSAITVWTDASCDPRPCSNPVVWKYETWRCRGRGRRHTSRSSPRCLFSSSRQAEGFCQRMYALSVNFLQWFLCTEYLKIWKRNIYLYLRDYITM